MKRIMSMICILLLAACTNWGTGMTPQTNPTPFNPSTRVSVPLTERSSWSVPTVTVVSDWPHTEYFKRKIPIRIATENVPSNQFFGDVGCQAWDDKNAEHDVFKGGPTFQEQTYTYKPIIPINCPQQHSEIWADSQPWDTITYCRFKVEANQVTVVQGLDTDCFYKNGKFHYDAITQ